MNRTDILLTLSVLVNLLLLVLWIRARTSHAHRPLDVDSALDDPDAVDVWEVQRDLMERSDQHLPGYPSLHNGVVLYAALNLEELGEMCCSLSNALAHSSNISKPHVPAIAGRFLTTGRWLSSTSRELRKELALAGDIGGQVLSPTDARALFDDTTDLMVTNAGFALSCGFPGGAGYAEVQDSNLSKANPETGKIDKTSDGKWIKGAGFFQPDLLRVLAKHRPHWAVKTGTPPYDKFDVGQVKIINEGNRNFWNRGRE